MKVLLIAVNAKYIHSNPAIYDLKAYSKKYEDKIELAEYTINQYREDIVKDIFKKRPDVLGISCYIWNIKMVSEVIRDVHEVLPQVPIWLGGPEVSYDAEGVLCRETSLKGVIVGEGEQTFLELMEHYFENKKILKNICGLVYRTEDGQIITNASRETMDLNLVPFVYENMTLFEHKIVYYESSRGCPFACSYCLSSIDKKVRFRDFALVKKELQYFIEQKVPQVKFVDRTFNCNRERARQIWNYIKEHDNGFTNFHFEVGADLIEEEELELLSGMRPGLVQLEIGIQTVNPKTLKEIRRIMDLDKLKSVVKRIQKNGNIHQHLDLIAGLPYEDYNSFKDSFAAVYELHPEQLQLGFLKVLKGSIMQDSAEQYGIVYSQIPPYEVLFTRWISFEEILKLKAVEEMVEQYYNSSQFNRTLEYCITMYDNPFDFYYELAEYYETKNLNQVSHSRMTRYEVLKEFLTDKNPEDEQKIRELLTWDLYARENLKYRPAWMTDLSEYKERIFLFYKMEEQRRSYLKEYGEYNYKQMSKMTHIEIFTTIQDEVTAYLFDYHNRNAMNNDATVYQITL